MLALIALLAAGTCAALAVSAWRTQRAAVAVAAQLSSVPANPASATDRAPPSTPPLAAHPPPISAPRRLDIAWRDGDGRHLRSRIALDDRGGARVETSSDGRPLVAYRATVQRRGNGTLIVDATDAAVAGPAAADWAADSFTISSDGSVRVHDGTHAPCAGYLAQESEQQTR